MANPKLPSKSAFALAFFLTLAVLFAPMHRHPGSGLSTAHAHCPACSCQLDPRVSPPAVADSIPGIAAKWDESFVSDAIPKSATFSFSPPGRAPPASSV
ncbi:MAG: hypothetical protein HYV63_34530 [Candidatus Schekmanbacteria bacterium]|nr:hypothetical protein [Candidatus Schekmanbacteria bacterium]